MLFLDTNGYLCRIKVPNPMKPATQIAKKIPIIAMLGSLLSALSGCVYEKIDPFDCPINFKSSIDALTGHTRAANTDWHESDRIGVYMVGAGGTITAHSLGTNVLHRHTGGGNFAAEPDGALFYPRIGEVDFAAYYPWRTTYADHRYPVDVADQSDHPAIDFMYSDNATGHSGGDVPLLEFHHKLTKLVFNITDMTGASVDGLEATITGLATRGVFHFSEGRLTLDGNSKADIEPAEFEDGDDATSTTRLEAIVLPEADIAPVVDFTLPDGTMARLRLVDCEYLGGKVYIYEVKITEGGQVVFGGGTVIVDWDDQDRAPGQYQIPKGDPTKPDDPSEKKTRYFFETLGDDNGALDLRPKINDYTGWDNADGVEFSDRLGGADVRRSGPLDAHIYFPADKYADLEITGLPSNRSNITLGYDIAAEEGGVRANLIAVYAGTVNVTQYITATIPSPNRYVRVSVDIPSGVGSLRFVSDPDVNTCGVRIDNISLEGVGMFHRLRPAGQPQTGAEIVEGDNADGEVSYAKATRFAVREVAVQR